MPCLRVVKSKAVDDGLDVGCFSTGGSFGSRVGGKERFLYHENGPVGRLCREDRQDKDFKWRAPGNHLTGDSRASGYCFTKRA